MASKLNSEFNYRYQVIGDTPWERIKTLKGFLEGRIRAAALQEVGKLKEQATLAELRYLEAEGNGLEHEILRLKADIMEAETGKAIAEEAYELNKTEIEIIAIKKLLVIAAKIIAIETSSADKGAYNISTILP